MLNHCKCVIIRLVVKILVKTPRAIRRAKRREFFESLLGGMCVGCGSDKNLEFDHVLPEDKCFNLATSAMECSLNKILPELQKCQLLCRKCHYKKTASDNGYNLPQHGTPSMYTNHKCRCELCTQVWATYAKGYVQRHRDSKQQPIMV